MKLDNRPKKLLVKGVADAGVQAVRDWFEVRYQSLRVVKVNTDKMLNRQQGRLIPSTLRRTAIWWLRSRHVQQRNRFVFFFLFKKVSLHNR